jgi:3',5'-cyclic AMP phosphodiesterase CpdA
MNTSPFAFQLAPTQSTATLVQVSDIHFGDAAPEVLEAAIDAIAALEPSCLIVTGDITQAGRKREFAQAQAWFERIRGAIKGAIIATPGNHDAPVYAPYQRLTAPFRRFRRLGLGDFWRHADGVAAAATFNSARALQWRPDWSQGVYALADLDRAAQRCKLGAPEGWRVLACHHPPVTPQGSPLIARTRNGAAGVQALRSQPRTILLSGHVHAFTVARRGEAHLLTAPSLASSRERGGGRGFLVLRLSQDSGQVEPWRFERGVFARDGQVALPTAAAAPQIAR